jgi:hypothetical protein
VQISRFAQECQPKTLIFHCTEQIAARIDGKVKFACLAGWRTTMKSSFLVSVGFLTGLTVASLAMASTVTTEWGRPLLVPGQASVAACGDVALSTETGAQSWHDALADKRAHDRVVQASWQNALANKRAQDRAVVLAGAESATDCALTN